MIFSFFDFPMKIVSYEAIITGKGVGCIYDSDEEKKIHEKKSEKLKNCKK